jgi:recombination protein RecR
VSSAYSPLLQRLIRALQSLPGVGQKSAQRMAFHLLDRDPPGARQLATALAEAVELIQHCRRCRMLTEQPECGLCVNTQRDGAQLCVVETPADLVALEQSGAYRGKYFVLMGHLSPIDGIGPTELGLDLLEQRFKSEPIEEVVLATGVTVEGDATAHLVATLAQRYGLRATRIAYGVPVGGELEFVDGSTLARALGGRREVERTHVEELKL